LADFHGSWPIFTEVRRFPWQSGGFSRKFADFRGSLADFHGSCPISTEVRRFPRKFADFPGNPANITEVRRLPQQSDGLRCKPKAFFVNRQLFVPDV
jgi:hypothetical protein